MAGLAVRGLPGCCSDALPLCSAAMVPALLALLLSTPQSAIMTSKDVSPLLLPAQASHLTYIILLSSKLAQLSAAGMLQGPPTDSDVRTRSDTVTADFPALQRLM